jgi:hypothetical protein
LIIKGDLEGNGRISVLSRAIVYFYTQGYISTLTNDQIQHADINNDGVVNSSDGNDMTNHLNGSNIISEVVY